MRRAAIVRRLVPLLLVALVLGACSSPDPAPEPGPAEPQLLIRTSAGDVRVEVEIADELEERQTGLMGRESLEADAGMAFVWSEEFRGSFWMKDTLIPLSIAFWDDRSRIVAILDMEPCEADPCPSYDPEVRFLGALEVNAGFFDEHGVRVGDRIELIEEARP